MAQTIPRGIYKHYKGGHYRVIGTSVRETDHTIDVNYRPMGSMPKEFSHIGIWSRPLDEFLETLPSGQPRFQKIARIPSWLIYFRGLLW